MGKWLIWDGRRWAVDDLAVVTQKAKVMARKTAQQAARILEEGRRKAVEGWARISESQTSIMAALKRASSEPGIAVRASQLDQHPYLLNCRNGIIDLETGKLRLHDRSLLITKLCHVDYDPQATCPRFLQSLEWTMGGGNPDAEVPEGTGRLVAFLQRAFGYSLTADVSEKVAFVLWGDGENGKTTLLSVFKKLLKEYAAEISVDTLMASRLPDASLRADLAELRGARFVTTSEVEKDSRLSEGKLKYITAGMGDIQTCRKYEDGASAVVGS
jgi:putative DNA primase/helicase